MQKRFLVGAVLVLAFAAVGYLGYRLADTFLFSFTNATMVIRTNKQQDVTIQLTKCRLLTNSGGSEQLLISDGNQNGMKIYPQDSQKTAFTAIIQGKELPLGRSACTIERSTLQLATVRAGGNFTTTQVASSWKGAIKATCNTPTGQILLDATVHACQ